MKFPRLIFLAGLAALAGCGPASALLHDPKAQPCLFDDCRVRYQPGAEALAARVDTVLPEARARVEALQGRPFGAPVTIVAYADEADYAAANGRGSAVPSGVAFLDRVTLSPRLIHASGEDIDAYLTHEMSHAHLLSHMSSLSLVSIPSWYTEGLAVLASGGGGAQKVSPDEARRAIAAGQTIDPIESEGLFQFSLPGARGFKTDSPLRGAHMAYRQAGLFVGFLRDRDAKAFAALLDGLFAGQDFKTAFHAAYGAPVAAFWDEFARDCARKGA
jgi:hypothetical protein